MACVRECLFCLLWEEAFQDYPKRNLCLLIHMARLDWILNGCEYYIDIPLLLREPPTGSPEWTRLQNSQKRRVAARRSLVARPIDHSAPLSSFCHRPAPTRPTPFAVCYFATGQTPALSFAARLKSAAGGSRGAWRGAGQSIAPRRARDVTRTCIVGCMLIVVDHR